MTYHSLLTVTLPSARTHQSWSGLTLSAACLAIAQAKPTNTPILLICSSLEETNTACDLLNYFLGTSRAVHRFPDWETLPYDTYAPAKDVVSNRLRLLANMPHMNNDIIVVAAHTLMLKLPPRSYIEKHIYYYQVGTVFHRQAEIEKLERAGYTRVHTVYEPGEYAVRGAVFDLFPIGGKSPIRLDFIDDEIDSIRQFNTETQLTSGKLETFKLLPAHEYPLNQEGINQFSDAWYATFPQRLDHSLIRQIREQKATPGAEYFLPLFYDPCDSLLAYLPEKTTVIDFGLDHIDHAFAAFQERYDTDHALGRPILSPEKIASSYQELSADIQAFSSVNCCSKQMPNAQTAFQTHLSDKNAHALNFIKQCPDSARLLICVSNQTEMLALQRSLKEIGIKADFTQDWQLFLASDSQYAFTLLPLRDSFFSPTDNIGLIASKDLLPKQAIGTFQSVQHTEHTHEHPQDTLLDLANLEIGMPIVHIQYGVGRYMGLEQVELNGETAEYLHIRYDNDDTLYVPVHNLGLVGRYMGGPTEGAPINRLGAKKWQAGLERAKKQAFDIAANLLKAYARREAEKRKPYQIPEEYSAFISHFPFVETPDQLKATEDILTDLKTERFMDRLICGDVGFGKTEVAMRAAFVIASNHRQVALLAPTTLLAEQHGRSFKERFAGFPINIEILTRFRTPKEHESIAKRLESGGIDIVVGTHKILNAKLVYKNLGLLIVDEEHRFGVKHKEKLRQLKSAVDVLTMTATPIPRTLNLSMSGLRDLSIIQTPPPGRLPIETIVIEENPLAIRDGMTRELHRGGQVFYLYNAVKSIAHEAQMLQEQIPHGRIGIAHGQMPQRQLESVMQAFYQHEIDILVCSTIIESGIDVPNANTLVIKRADKFGLAELHQLRGRVGRSHTQAYAYLIVPEEEYMTKDALLRIEAIKRAGGLGAGFSLAMEDLEIRGAGELLGKDQSGDIHEVGYQLFQNYLKQAITNLQEGRLDPELKGVHQTIEVELQISALLPESFIPDIPTRLEVYERLAKCENAESVDQLALEVLDRFGPLPEPSTYLLEIKKIECQAAALKLDSIKGNLSQVQFNFSEHAKIDFSAMIRQVQIAPKLYQLSAKGLKFTCGCETPAQLFEKISECLTFMSGKSS